MILIGSKAIRHWYSDFNRDGKDWDFIITSRPGEIRVPAEYLKNDVLSKYPGDILEPDLLLTLKMSHLFWNIHWDKHMWDVQFLLKKGCKVNEPLFYKLYDYWNTVHEPNRRSKLNMSKDDFFTNAINYDTFEHDDLHKILNPVPVYTKILKGEVELDENKWEELSYDDKLNLVREEVMVMAYERFKELNYRIAYHRMFKKFIMNHAPMWSAIFTIQNYITLQKPTFNYYEKIRQHSHIGNAQ